MFPRTSDNSLPCRPGIHSSSRSPGCCPSLIPEAPGSWPDHGQASRAGFCECAVLRHQGKGFIAASAPSLAPSFQWHSQGRFLPAIQNSETALRVDSSNQLSNVSFSAQHSLLITKHHLLAFQSMYEGLYRCIDSFTSSPFGSRGCIFLGSIFSHSTLFLQFWVQRYVWCREMTPKNVLNLDCEAVVWAACVWVCVCVCMCAHVCGLCLVVSYHLQHHGL